MSSLQHLFVPLELARLAKEKGFNEPCLNFYSANNEEMKGGRLHYNSQNWQNYSGDYKNSTLTPGLLCAAAPLYQQLVDWLEQKGVILVLLPPTRVSPNWSIHLSGDGLVIAKHASKYEALNAALTHAFTLI